MKNILTIMSKEFTRFFTDKRMVIATILPAVIIYFVYSFMGTMMTGRFTADEDHTPWVYSVNTPSFFTQFNINTVLIEANEIDTVKERILKGEVDLLVIFPENFDALVDAYDVRLTPDKPAPNIEMFFNSTAANSNMAFYTVTAMLDAYEATLSNKFDINRGIENPDLASIEEVSANIIAMMMPMLLMIFLYSGCMGLALESITGEKERGTLATLLVSPLKRRELAVGKILSIAVLAFLSGSLTAIATILSLPNLMGGIETNIYSVVDYILLAIIILTVLLLMVSLLSIISAFARTIKEAGQATMPLMVLIMLVGVSGMIGGGTQAETIYFIVPLYSSVKSMSGIFALDYSPINIALSAISTTIYAGICGYVLTKMFDSEKIMFSR
ncbi:MAG: ABC transporter permease subunit [Oscillospiraceae bacterium]|jgi:sodium transport system permease protein|nr:ABC transporter permease subunit [Oscillospiraceae bacterium]